MDIMKHPILQLGTLCIGLVLIVSSVFFIESASAYKYEMLLERDHQNPGSVSNEEWIMSKDDAGMTFFVLMLFGIPAFLITSGIALVGSALIRKLKPIGVVLGLSWICCGVLCHVVVWTV